ncbi:MAG: hypothetical protein HKL95_11130 [Phycisphaerae bacterium]|nr:hypothetical protein [Phycisphaerae bacterium]
MMKIVAYQGFGQSVEPSRRNWRLPYALRVVLTLLVGAVTFIAAFFFLFVVVVVLLCIAAFAIAAYTVRRLVAQTRSKLQQHGHRVARISVFHDSPYESAGERQEYWSDEQGYSRT